MEQSINEKEEYMSASQNYPLIIPNIDRSLAAIKDLTNILGSLPENASHIGILDPVTMYQTYLRMHHIYYC